MNGKILNILKKNKKLLFTNYSLSLFQAVSFTKTKGGEKKYPKVIQLPITYKCNSKCVMCNIWQMDHSDEASVEEFARFMQDPIFKEVEAVGINGGEPSLITNLPEYTDEILKLPNIKKLNIISHGFSSKPLLNSLEKIYESCQAKNINFHVAISLDGVGEVHNTIRGRAKVFEITTATIDEIIKNKHKYCDSYDIGCTIVNQNVDYLIELDSFAKSKKYNIKYRLGIENKRIGSDKLVDQYSVIHSTSKQSAKEFFHYQAAQAKNLKDKFKYFSIFYWLNAETPKRLMGCAWKNEGVTLDSRGELYYCAVASNSIGSLRKASGEKIFFDEKNLEYRENIINDVCNNCIHDYSGKPEFKSLMIFFREVFFSRLATRIYRVKAKFIR